MTNATANRINEIETIEAAIEAERFKLALAKSEGEADLYIFTDMIRFLKDELHDARIA